MALFTTAADWDTDPATDKLCDMLVSQQPKIKKKKHLKKALLSGQLGQNSEQKQLKEEDKRHAQRYQKNRKKKQLMRKKAVKEDTEEEGMRDEKALGVFKKTKKVNEKSGQSEKKAKSVSETALPKADASSTAEMKVAKKQKKVKKAKKDPEEKEQHVSSPALKKNKNKYKHLAGKGKRMETLTLAHDANPAGSIETASPKECSMDIDSDLGKKQLKSGLKRKLHESDDANPQKKAKLKEASSRVVESSIDTDKQKQPKKIETATPINSPGVTEKKQKKKKKSKDVLGNGNAGVDVNVDADEQKQFKKKETTTPIDSPSITEKKQKKKKKSKDVHRNGNTGVKSQESAGTITEHSVNTKPKVTVPKPSLHKSPKQLDKIRSLLEAKDSKATPQSDPTGPQITSPKRQPVKPSGPLSLKERMEEQLKASRFRYLNEQLYTNDSKSAQELFAEDPEAFQVYHHGYQAQVSKWPANPVDRAISFVKERAENLVVVDFGCGDAKLAQSVPNKVHSFDLVAVNKHVTVADSANVPLPDRSVDIAVFSLSLMGTNFVDFLIEANRVLKQSGTLLIAEVVSRFEKVQKFVKKLEKLGFKLVNMDKSNKMFVWFELSKTKTVNQDMDIPDLELLPCIYKKR